MHFKKLVSIIMGTCVIVSSVLGGECVEAYSTDDLSVGKKIEILSENLQDDNSNKIGQAVLEYNIMMDNFEEDDKGDVNYPDYYAGSYIDDAGELVVCSVSDNNKNIKKIKQDVEKDNVKIVKKEYSYNELLKLKNMIEKKIKHSAKKSELLDAIVTIGIDDKNNTLVVEVIELNDNEIHKLKTMFGNSNKIVIKRKTKEEEIQPRVVSLAAGMKTYYTLDGYDAFYSIGYKAFRLTSTGEFEYGFVTAGHSNEVGYAMKYASENIGIITGRNYSGSVDASFVKITNSNYEMSNNIYYTSEVADGRNYISYLPVGATVYKVGATTQLTSGTVTYSSVTVDYTNNQGIFTDFLGTSIPSSGGDSGGLVYAPYGDANLVVGILDAGGSTSSYVCKCGNIESAMGVYIY